MHLISTLCAGVMGAANGWAEIYIRDTATRATTYGDFEASTSNSSGANITLDAYGSVEVYVNQLVDVVVKDADGVVVRSFTDGYSSPNIEVISPAFTGTDYVTAASAVNEPTTLQAVLNLWETNAGAPDWKVNVGGVSSTLENAIGNVSGQFFNVKSPAYGALGNGTTDDSGAITAAHAAAVAAGGGVVLFPPGTYRITAGFTWSQLVSILGAGATISTIKMDAASGSTLTFSSSFTGRNRVQIRNISFSALQANTSAIINCSALARLQLDGCAFALDAFYTGRHLSFAAGGELYVRSCTFYLQGTAAPSISDDFAAVITAYIESSRFIAPATFNSHLVKLRGDVWFDKNYLDFVTNSTSGTFNGIEIGTASGNKAFITNNRFNCTNAMAVGVNITGGIQLFAGKNQFEAAVTLPYAISAILAAGSYIEPFKSGYANDGAGNVNIDPLFFSGEISTTWTSAVSIRLPRTYWVGQPMHMVLHNASAATWGSGVGFSCPTGSTPDRVAGILALDAGLRGSVSFIAVADGLWAQLGASVEDY